MTRSVFAPAIIMIPFIYFALHYRKETPLRLLLTLAVLIAAVAVMLKLRPLIFEESTIVQLKYILMNTLPGRSNMESYLFSQHREMDWGLIIARFFFSIRYQFLPDSRNLILFYFPFNAMVALLFFRLHKQSGVMAQVVYLAILSAGIHVATILIHQNQFRYMLVVFPAVLAANLVIVEQYIRLNPVYLRRGLIVLITGLFVLSIPLALFQRRDARHELEQMDRLKKNVGGFVGGSDRILSYWNDDQAVMIAYALQPAIMVDFPLDGSPEYFRQVIEKVHPDWLLCKPEVMRKVFREMRWGDPHVVSEVDIENYRLVLVPLKDLPVSMNRRVDP